MTDVDMMLRFLLQMILIIACCKAVGWLGVKFLGQTQVVMEMVTGVCLGPSLFGALAPKLQAEVFPATAEGGARHPSMIVLYVVAQLGLVLYMFLIGLEFNASLLTQKAKGALSISLSGIILPFALGAACAWWTFTQGGFGLYSPTLSLGEAALYTGAAMCITAFPMLARILYERGIAQTTMGTVALAAGASDDASAWAILAIVLASYKHDVRYAIFAIGGGALFAVFMFKIVKPIAAKIFASVEESGELKQTTFVVTMFLLFVSAYFTDAIGVYAVFGAFLCGAALPRGKFAVAIREKVESLTVGCLLPFFFVYSGLNTKMGLVNSPLLWGICALLCSAAILGKFGGCAIAAKLSGEPWRESVAIGTLMNARGLMELIILNIGLQRKVITPTFFTIMVLMAIITTLMASPIFNWLYREKSKLPIADHVLPEAV